MKKIHIILAFFMLFVSPLMAVNIQQFQRSNSLTYEKLEDGRLSNSHVYSDYDMIFTLGGSWVDSPLTVKDPANANQLDTIIKGAWALHFGLGYYFSDNLMFGAASSFTWLDAVHQANEKGFSDVELKLKWRFAHGEKYALSIVPMLNLPLHGGNAVWQTATTSFGQDSQLSDESIGFGGLLAYERVFKHLSIVANLGFRYAQGALFIDSAGKKQVDKKHLLMTGLGAYIPMGSSLGLNLEWLGQWTFPLFNGDQEPNEFHVGMTTAMSRNFHLYTGVGFGNLFSGKDGNDYRLSAGIKFTPTWNERREPVVAVIPSGRPAPVVAAAPVAPVANICRSRFVFGESNQAVVRFPNDVAAVQGNYMKRLLAVSRRLQRRLNDIEMIEVIGHTSVSGSSAYNQRLSERRARNTINYLVEQGALPREKFRAVGRGEDELLDSSGSARAAVVNRRTEFSVRLNSRFQSCY